jgi:hypothetical protein
LAITTIRVVSRADLFKAKGSMLKGMSVGKVRVRHELKLRWIAISMKRMELKKVMGSVRRRTNQGLNRKGFRLKARKDIKGMGRDDVREARDHSNAVPGIGGLKEGSVIG